MIRGAIKAIVRQIPPVDALIRHRDALRYHRDALLVELEKTKSQFETAKSQFETAKNQFETAKSQFETAKAASDALIRHRDGLLRERENLKSELLSAKAAVGRPHFVNDYIAHVRELMKLHPIDEAMSLAVGGSYDEVGRDELAILQRFGLIDGMTVVDLGCGSGRLAKHLGLAFQHLEYLGIDVVQELLDYAATKSPAHFRFMLHREISLPAAVHSADFVAAFSVFTHLFHEETYMYLREAKKVLRPGGKIVLSFLESRHSWKIFEEMVKHRKNGNEGHLNMFIERAQIDAWSKHLGMQVVGFDFGLLHDGHGQTVAVLNKPE